MQQRSNTQHDDIVGLRVRQLRTHNAHQKLAASECWSANFETPWFFPLINKSETKVRPFNVEPLSVNTHFSQSLSLSLSLVVSLYLHTHTHLPKHNLHK